MKISTRTALFAGSLTLALLVVLYVVATLDTRAAPTHAYMHIPSAQAVQNATIEVELEGFQPGEMVTLWQTFPDYKVLPLRDVQVNNEGNATVSLFMDPSLPLGAHSLSARGNLSTSIAINQFQLDAPHVAVEANSVVLSLITSGEIQGNTYTFEGTGYKPAEPVSLWLTLPGGSVRDLDIVEARDGSFTYRFTPSIEDPIGTYYLTGFGRSSKHTGVVSFDVQTADYLAGTAEASLEIWPAQVRQLDVVKITGRGFTPGEVVGLWITLPDGSVVSLYEGVTLTGAFQEQIYLPAVIPEGGLPIGFHNFSAYGKTSGKRAITSLELLPGEGE